MFVKPVYVLIGTWGKDVSFLFSRRESIEVFVIFFSGFNSCFHISYNILRNTDG